MMSEVRKKTTNPKSPVMPMMPEAQPLTIAM